MNLNEDLIKFWDESARDLEPGTYSKEDFEGTDELTRMYKFIGDNAENVLDYGCGYGFGVMSAKVLGKKMKYGLGIDTSSNMIKYASQTVENSKIEGIEFIIGNEDKLDELTDKFDGVICSNVLDVVPKEISNSIIEKLTKSIKQGGYLLIKFNFYIDDNVLSKMKNATKEGNYIFINGILRGNNLETKAWIKKFKDFDLVEQSEFPRAPSLPNDRVLLFKKR